MKKIYNHLGNLSKMSQISSNYDDLRRNLLQGKLNWGRLAERDSSGREEHLRRLEETSRALQIYDELINRYPDFAIVEKTTTEGFFPDLVHETHGSIPIIMQERLKQRFH